MGGRSKGRNTIMLIAGVYLIYLGTQIIRTGIIGGQISEKWKWLGLLCAIAFIVFGAGETILCIRNLFMNTTDEQAEEALENAENKAASLAEASETDKAEEEPVDTETERRQRSIQEMIRENTVEEPAEDEGEE